jgi:hypothetical protein
MFLGLFVQSSLSLGTPAASIAAQYGLTATTTLPFPTATTSDVAGFGLANNAWSLSKAKIQNNPGNLAFVNDPFPTSGASGSSNPVLQVTYASGKFGSTDSGSQFYSFWNGSYQSVLLSYEVAFDKNFEWVKGGKLPGLRGGLDINGCDGGKQPNGTDCFSTRLMWRKGGQGEAYSYIRTVDGICSQNQVLCNDDFGTSMGRGLFLFNPGEWNKVSLLVRLNNPPNTANGNLQLYFNDLLAVEHGNIQYRNGDALNTIGGLYFSSFFGGNDASWAPSSDQHAYFRNFQMWGSTAPSNLTGHVISGSQHTASALSKGTIITSAILTVVGGAFLSSLGF